MPTYIETDRAREVRTPREGSHPGHLRGDDLNDIDANNFTPESGGALNVSLENQLVIGV